MPSKTIIFASLAILSAVFYQVILKNILFVTFGFGRTYQRIEEFPYDCRRLRYPLLESCEDLVLDSEGRTVYAACSTSLGRKAWSPGGNKYNISGRTLTDHVSVLKIDEPGEDGLYRLHQLEVTGNYRSANGGKDLAVVGFDIEVIRKDRLRFWMVNNQPPVDDEGNLLDATKLGANSTVEVFELTRGSTKWEHIKTIFSDAVFAPNNIAAVGDGSFLVTNDHDNKVSMFRELAFLTGGGSVAYCGFNNQCHIANNHKSWFANGVVKGHDGLYYVAQSAGGKIYVYSLQEDHSLLKIDEINVGMGLDNLSVDDNGDLFVAGFPKVLALVKALEDPLTTEVPSTIFRIKKSVDGEGKATYEVTKALEDIEGKVLPGSTVAVHDVKTDTFFMGGVTSPFITVCKRQS